MKKQMKEGQERAKRIIALVFALCLMGSALAENAPVLLEPVGVEMDTAVVYRGEIRDIAVYEGAVRPAVKEAYFEVNGYVGQVHVLVGQQVKKGDKLITLDQESQEKQRESLETNLERQKKNDEYDDALSRLELEMLQLELEEMLFRGEAASQIALKELQIEEEKLNQSLEKELRQREIARTEAQLQALQKETEAQVLYAPMDGTVIFGEELRKGSYVRAYHPLIYLADDSSLTIESDYISGAVQFHEVYAISGGKRYELEMIVVDPKENVSRMLAGETITTQFTILNPDEALQSGQYAVICTVTRYAKDAVLIPSNALYSDADGWYVYTVNNGRRSRRGVKLGISNDYITQITEGLEEGEVIYVKE